MVCILCGCDEDDPRCNCDWPTTAEAVLLSATDILSRPNYRLYTSDPEHIVAVVARDVVVNGWRRCLTLNLTMAGFGETLFRLGERRGAKSHGPNYYGNTEWHPNLDGRGVP